MLGVVLISSLLFNMNGIYMILSPAKTFDLNNNNNNDIPPPPSPGDEATTTKNQSSSSTTSAATTCRPYCNYHRTKQIVQVMKQRTESDLMKLLKLSKSLAQTSKQYWNDFQFVTENDSRKTKDDDDTIQHPGKPCIYTFAGPAFQGIDLVQYNDWKNNPNHRIAMNYMQQYLRIIDPVYGILKPFDTIQPYRLEMFTKYDWDMKDTKKEMKLQEYWSHDVTQSLSNDINHAHSLRQERKNETKNKKNENRRDRVLLVNLASEEYSMVVQVPNLPSSCCYVKIIFMESHRIVSIHVKRARGLMVRYICQNQCQTISDLKQFNLEGYQFLKQEGDEEDDAVDTNNETTKKKPKMISLYFNREKQGGTKSPPPQQQKKQPTKVGATATATATTSTTTRTPSSSAASKSSKKKTMIPRPKNKRSKDEIKEDAVVEETKDPLSRSTSTSTSTSTKKSKRTK
jgi:uncharacterized protein